ncbi:MAG: metal-sensitive transcriptional regulator [Patescibacteria group bacterium]
MTTHTDKELINQLHRAQGQLDGVERMMSECRSCEDVVMQLMAARSSIERLTVKLLEEETQSCLKSKNRSEVQRLQKVAATLFKYT